MLPSVTAIAAVSTLYCFPTRRSSDLPLAKVTVVAVPKLTALGVLLVTVGWVTGLAEALAPEKVSDLSQMGRGSWRAWASWAVIVGALLATAVWLAPPVSANVGAAAAVTATVSRSAPVVVIAPWVATMLAVSALYSFLAPLLWLETGRWLVVKVIVVAVPKLTTVPVLSVTVGWVTGLAEALAPEKVSDLS